MRQSRKRLRARAERAAESWANDPKNHKDAVLRSMLSWLSGYDAARRDARKVKCAKIAERFSHGVRGPTSRRGAVMVLVDDGQDGEAGLTIPALSQEQRECSHESDGEGCCLGCGAPC